MILRHLQFDCIPEVFSEQKPVQVMIQLIQLWTKKKNGGRRGLVRLIVPDRTSAPTKKLKTQLSKVAYAQLPDFHLLGLC